jgi:integrase
VISLHTGMRRGEILKLKWSDVDLNNRVITIQESKSGKKRTIPIDETLLNAIKRLPSRFRREWVFPSPNDPSQPRHDFRRLTSETFDAAGFDDLHFHDLRHTFASHLVMNGVDLRTVQELLGHYSVSMTMKYSHLVPDHRTRAVKILESAYQKPTKKNQTDTKTDTVKKTGTDQSA